MIAAELGGDEARESLRYLRRGVEAGQWWRLVTGNFVHAGWYHWGLNAAALVIFSLLCPQRRTIPGWSAQVLVLCLGVTLGLYFFDRRLSYYVGMSGMIHGLFVVGLLPQVVQRDRIAALCLVFLVGKLAYEQMAGAPLSDEAAIGERVITDAHLWGGVTGLAWGLLTLTRRSSIEIQGESAE